MASNTALVSAPLEEAAHIGHVDVLERSGESLTVSWRKPLAAVVKAGLWAPFFENFS